MPRHLPLCLCGLLIAAALVQPASGQTIDVEHPFLLWTADELAARRQLIDSQPWAREAWEQWSAQRGGPNRDAWELFAYAVMGDLEAGERQKRELLSMLDAAHPWGSSVEWRILAYDLLYHELTPEQRDALQQAFRRYIEYSIKPGGLYDSTVFNNARNYARYDGMDGWYTRTNWLPNIVFPRKLSANLMALVLRDEPLIRQTWSEHGSIQYYIDSYLGDTGFYSEEFSKMTPIPGTLLMYGVGARNLGLDELGFGYRRPRSLVAGRQEPASIRGHIESMLRITYPRIDLGTQRPQYPRLTIGDVRGYGPFQDQTVRGYYADGSGGNPMWRAAGAWGGVRRGNHYQWDGYTGFTSKWAQRLWYEMGHALWPDAGFDYFLAQMRAPEDDRYYPTLLLGLTPIDPAAVNPPPAPSAVYPERGLVMLRFDESPRYWESPAPAMGFRLAAPYAHSVNDSFAIAGFYAFNRPIYLNPKPGRGYAFGFDRSVRSHASVMVDGHIRIDDWGRTGSLEPGFSDQVTTRQGFTPEVKFVSARTSGRYPGVTESRSFILTQEYLLDVFTLESPSPRSYTWIAHALGYADDEPGFEPSEHLAELISELTHERSRPVDGQDWSVTIRQTPRPGEPIPVQLGNAWFDRTVGVRMRMLAEPGVRAHLARVPWPMGREGPVPPLMEYTSIVARQSGRNANFVVLHEPFEGQPRLSEFRRIAQTDEALAAAVVGAEGSGIDDRLLLRLGFDPADPATLEGEGESFTFADWAYVRAGAQEVIVRGDLRQMRLRVGDRRPRLIVNGQPAEASFEEGLLVYER